MSKQTAVEWIYEKLSRSSSDELVGNINLWFQQAKALEREQIEEAFVECWQANMPDGYECKLGAVEYYNETYGGDK